MYAGFQFIASLYCCAIAFGEQIALMLQVPNVRSLRFIYFLERSERGFKILESFFVMHFVCLRFYFWAELYAGKWAGLVRTGRLENGKARTRRVRGHSMRQSKLIASACDNEEHCSQKRGQDNEANGQERHIRRQDLSDASRFRSFLVQDHISSRLWIGQARKERAPVLLLTSSLPCGGMLRSPGGQGRAAQRWLARVQPK